MRGAKVTLPPVTCGSCLVFQKRDLELSVLEILSAQATTSLTFIEEVFWSCLVFPLASHQYFILHSSHLLNSRSAFYLKANLLKSFSDIGIALSMWFLHIALETFVRYMQIPRSKTRRQLFHLDYPICMSKVHILSYGDTIFFRVTCDADATGRWLQLAQQMFKTHTPF